MPIRNLNKLFYPRSLAVIGATNDDSNPGNRVMHNLLQGQFQGPVMPVSAGNSAIAGVLCYPEIAALPLTPDMAIISGSPREIPASIAQLGKLGTRAAIVLSQTETHEENAHGLRFHDAIRDEAKPFGMRVLGPNCMGLMVPHIGLNASTGHLPAATGGVAFVSQSAAICSSVLDWARQRDIGFSHFVSLGDAIDVDVADVLDYLGSDAMTRAILLYVETVGRGRTFMSAARGASRNKPILVIKSGRVKEGQRVAMFRSRSPIGADDVYDAAIRRAGILRVFSFGELFAAVETLARARPLKGGRLAVLTNGFGMAIMAADTLVTKGGQLAELSEETLTKLDAAIGNGGYHNNPVSIATDASPETYGAAARVLIDAKEVDALMVLHAPTGTTSSVHAAEAIVNLAHKARINVLTSWMGGHTAEAGRRLFAEAGIPTYDTPTQAIDAFMHMVRFHRNQEILMETPDSKPLDFTPDTAAARRYIAEVRAEKPVEMDDPDVRAVLMTYGIPTAEIAIAHTAEEAADLSEHLGLPVSLRVLRPDTDHQSAAIETAPLEVTPHLNDRDSVKRAAQAMLTAFSLRYPDAKPLSLQLKRTPLRSYGREVRIHVTGDPVFGPVIVFGRGGVTGHLSGDQAAALPPLNMNLAHELISRTRIAASLAGSGEVPPVDMDALCLTLVKISQLIVDIPEIVELDINPLVVDDQGVLAMEHRLRIASTSAEPEQSLAIRPYPKELEEEWVLPSGRRILLRPIRPEDEPDHYEFLSRVSPEDIRMRFFGSISRLPHTEMARLTQIDYDREMAVIATAPMENGKGRETLGVVRTFTGPNNESAEYAILVRSDLKGQRLGWKLLDKMVHYCRSRGTRRIVGQVLRENRPMLDLVHDMGFTSRVVPEEDIVEVNLEL
ncbi:MAG: bifunctional acetate--CoA ligase family protein/GNAT family N-acetyltransferase [Rhodospirillales bacterium]|nr:bifunctional acetate--CoA ligase family protein/GNAT family N-acetyltransferase [Rhodospirillales bacterium]